MNEALIVIAVVGSVMCLVGFIVGGKPYDAVDNKNEADENIALLEKKATATTEGGDSL